MPAATLAEYSPRLWPATKAGAIPRDTSTRDAAVLTARMGRLGVFGQRELILGTVENDAAERLAERDVGLRDGLAADRIGVGERPAHADLLRALSRKDERDHW